MKKNHLPRWIILLLPLALASCSVATTSSSPSQESHISTSSVVQTEDSSEPINTSEISYDTSIEFSSEQPVTSEESMTLISSEIEATSSKPEPVSSEMEDTSEVVETSEILSSESEQTSEVGSSSSEAESVSSEVEETSELVSSEIVSSQEASSIETSSVDESSLPTHGGTYDNSAFTIYRVDDELAPEFSEGMYKIYQGGEYFLNGTLVGMVYINVPEDQEVVLNLSGVDMSYGENSVIYCIEADKLEISAKKGTANKITDLRAVETTEDDLQGGGAIYSRVDTDFKGKGSLEVVGTYNNGIHVTKDLEIKNLTLKSTAVNHAIKGNDSLTIESGTITAISSGGDGLKTSDSDVSSKGNQRGDINILGGTVKVYSACDGIDAAHDAIIGSADDETAAPEIEIHTNKYSSYTNEDDIQVTSSETMYLRTTTNNTSYRYAVYFYASSTSDGTWADATYLTSARSGRSTYYYYSLERPASYNSFMIFAFPASQSEDSLTDYALKSSGSTINSFYDTVTFSIYSSSINTGSWSNYSASQQPGGGPGGGPGGFPGGGMQEGNSDKADASAKGIKAANEIKVYGGTIDIEAYDDGLHANYGETLENGETGVGNVTIAGGTTTIYASDDGVKADNVLAITGGNLTITHAYEGLEGNQVKISGGYNVINGSDDGINASYTDGLNSSPAVTVSGGQTTVFVPTSGDVDGIDSNGSFTVSGGILISCGPNQGMASALDVDGTAKVSGGTFLVFGNVETTPSATGVTSSSRSGTFSANATHTVTIGSSSIVTPTFPYSYSNVRAWSELGSIQSAS